MTHVSMTDFLNDTDPSTASPADLQALIVARLCHDLASPLGAITNGVELLEMVQAGGPEVALVAQSARQATARLRLFRMAFGQDGAGQATSAAEFHSVLRAHGETARCQTEYDIATEIPRAHAKLLTLGMLCLETALPWGGDIRFGLVGADYHLVAGGQRMKVDPNVWAMLLQPDPPARVTPALVQFAVLHQSAHRQGFQILVRQVEAALTLILRKQDANL